MFIPDPNFSIPDPNFSIPDHCSRVEKISKNLSIFAPKKTVSRKNDLGFSSRIQIFSIKKSPDPGSATLLVTAMSFETRIQLFGQLSPSPTGSPLRRQLS
jgi:hypothetical protein